MAPESPSRQANGGQVNILRFFRSLFHLWASGALSFSYHFRLDGETGVLHPALIKAVSLIYGDRAIRLLVELFALPTNDGRHLLRDSGLELCGVAVVWNKRIGEKVCQPLWVAIYATGYKTLFPAPKPLQRVRVKYGLSLLLLRCLP